MGSKKTTTNTTNSTNTVAPPEWTKAGYNTAGGMVNNAIANLPGADTYYKGDQVAQYDPTKFQTAMDAYEGAAGQAGAMSGWLNNQIIQTNPNPTFTTSVPTSTFDMGDRQQNLDAVIRASTNPVMQRLQQEILPSIRSSALDSGAYSNDRAMAVMPQQAITQATMDMGDIATKLGYDDYTNWENRRLAAFNADREAQLAGYGAETERQGMIENLKQQYMGMLPDLTNAVLAQKTSSGDLYQAIAEQDRQNKQLGIDNALAQEQYNIQRPFMGLDIGSDILGGLSRNYGTTTGSSNSKTVEKTGGLGAVAQGVLGAGLGIGSMFMGGAPLAGMFKKAAGGLAGGADQYRSVMSPGGLFG